LARDSVAQAVAARPLTIAWLLLVESQLRPAAP
jgi:hypothetical protein